MPQPFSPNRWMHRDPVFIPRTLRTASPMLGFDTPDGALRDDWTEAAFDHLDDMAGAPQTSWCGDAVQCYWVGA